MTHEDMISMIKDHEGFRRQPYKDTTGHLTIGYGTNLEAGISERQADALLWIHIEDRILKPLQHHGWFSKLDDTRKAVIIDMAYNLGLTGLLSFRNMINAIENNNYKKAADEMKNSLWYTQVRRRAQTLCRLMEKGDDSVLI